MWEECDLASLNAASDMWEYRAVDCMAVSTAPGYFMKTHAVFMVNFSECVPVLESVTIYM